MKAIAACSFHSGFLNGLLEPKHVKWYAAFSLNISGWVCKLIYDCPTVPLSHYKPVSTVKRYFWWIIKPSSPPGYGLGGLSNLVTPKKVCPVGNIPSCARNIICWIWSLANLTELLLLERSSLQYGDTENIELIFLHFFPTLALLDALHASLEEMVFMCLLSFRDPFLSSCLFSCLRCVTLANNLITPIHYHQVRYHFFLFQNTEIDIFCISGSGKGCWVTGFIWYSTKTMDFSHCIGAVDLYLFF